MRADDWQPFNRVEQGACNFPQARLDGKKSVWICQTYGSPVCANDTSNGDRKSAHAMLADHDAIRPCFCSHRDEPQPLRG